MDWNGVMVCLVGVRGASLPICETEQWLVKNVSIFLLNYSLSP